jgi:hypothetical protein
MKTEKQNTTPIFYISILASLVSVGIFAIYISGMLSRELMVSVAGAILGLFVSVFAITVSAYFKRGTIRVFFSYAYADADRVKKIREYLEMKGFILMGPETSVRIGDDITRAVDNALALSDGIIFVLSRQSATSPWIKKELEKARGSGKRLYPIIIDDIELPQEIANIRYADLREENADEMRKLVLAIRENHRR